MNVRQESCRKIVILSKFLIRHTKIPEFKSNLTANQKRRKEPALSFEGISLFLNPLFISDKK